jgi:hypothetical protein
MALDAVGLFAKCTPIMVWNTHFSDKEAYNAELFRQVQARHPFAGPPTVSRLPTSNPPSQRPKRAAVKRASAAWVDLSPQKR